MTKELVLFLEIGEQFGLLARSFRKDRRVDQKESLKKIAHLINVWLDEIDK